jgi:hypothetical protein
MMRGSFFLFKGDDVVSSNLQFPILKVRHSSPGLVGVNKEIEENHIHEAQTGI